MLRCESHWSDAQDWLRATGLQHLRSWMRRQAEDALLRHIAQHVAPPAVPASALFRALTTSTAIFATGVAACAQPR
jgi:hypothetical protein